MTSSEIKIDTGIPVPAGYGAKYPWRKMQPGESFFSPGASRAPSVLASYATRLIPNSKWITRTVTENGVTGVRVWRVE